MKRIVSPAIIVVLLLFLLPRERSFARDDGGIDLSLLKWMQLSATVSKTDLGTGLPEVLILKMTNDQFAKIYPDKNAAMAYLDSQHIFKQKLIDVVFCDITPTKNGVGWILIVPHTLHSTASIVAWQLPSKGKEE